MAALFAVGLMSLGWMALGLGVALIPGDVPGFATPDAAMHDGAHPDGAGMQVTR